MGVLPVCDIRVFPNLSGTGFARLSNQPFIVKWVFRSLVYEVVEFGTFHPEHSIRQPVFPDMPLVASVFSPVRLHMTLLTDGPDCRAITMADRERTHRRVDLLTGSYNIALPDDWLAGLDRALACSALHGVTDKPVPTMLSTK